MKNKLYYIITVAAIIFASLFMRPIKENIFFSGEHSYYYSSFFNLNIFLERGIVFVLAALSFYFLYRAFKNLKVERKFRFSFFFLLSISVPFLYLMSHFTIHSLIFFMLCFLIYLLSSEKKLSFFLASLVVLLSSFFGLYALPIVLTYLCYSLTVEKRRVLSTIISAISLILANSYFEIYNFVITVPPLQHLVADFGSSIGIGITFWLLALFGFFMTWRAKIRFTYIYLGILVLLILSMNYFFYVLYLNLGLVLMASYFYRSIVYRKWNFKVCGTLIQIALICSFLFTGIYYANRLSQEEPNNEMLDAFRVLSLEEDDGKGLVLSHPGNGFYITKFSSKPAMSTTVNKDPSLTKLLYGDQLKETLALLKENDVEYIWIDREMKEGQVWSDAEEGLLGLLPSRDHFTKIYESENIEIWRIK